MTDIPLRYKASMQGAGAVIGMLSSIKNSALGVAGAIAAIGVGSISAFAKLDQNVREATTLFPDFTSQTREHIRAMSRDIGNDLNLSINEVTEAFKVAGGAGIAFGDSMEFATTAARLARGAFTDVHTASNLLVTAMNAFNISAEDLSLTADKLAVVMDEGVFDNIQGLVSSFATAAPSAASLGVSIEQLGAALAIMTRSGYSAEISGVAVNRMLLSLSRSSSDVAAVFREVTGDSFPNFIAKGGDLIEALVILDDHLTETQKSAFDLFSTTDERGRRAFETLRQNFPEYAQLLDDLAEAHGNLEGRVEEAMGGITAVWEGLKTTLGSTLESIGNFLVDHMNSWLGSVDTFTDAFSTSIETWLNGSEEFIQAKLTQIDGIFDSHYKLLLERQGLYTEKVIELEKARMDAKDKLAAFERRKIQLQQQIVVEIFKKYAVHAANVVLRGFLGVLSAFAKVIQLTVSSILRAVRNVVHAFLQQLSAHIAQVVNGIGQILENGINALISLANSFIRQINALLSLVGRSVPTLGHVSFGRISPTFLGLPEYVDPPGFRDDWFGRVYKGLEDALTINAKTHDDAIGRLVDQLAEVNVEIKDFVAGLKDVYPQHQTTREIALTNDPEGKLTGSALVLDQATKAAEDLENLQRNMGSYQKALGLTAKETLPAWAKRLAEAGLAWEDLNFQTQYLILAQRDEARMSETLARIKREETKKESESKKKAKAEAKSAAEKLLEQTAAAALALKNLQTYGDSYRKALQLTTDETLPNWAKRLAEVGLAWESLDNTTQWLIRAQRDEARAAEAVAEAKKQEKAAIEAATKSAQNFASSFDNLLQSFLKAQGVAINPITGQILGSGPQAANAQQLKQLQENREKFKKFYNEFWQLPKDKREAYLKKLREANVIPGDITNWQQFKQFGRLYLQDTATQVRHQKRLAAESLRLQEKYAAEEHAYRMAGIDGYTEGEYLERLLVLNRRLDKAKTTPGLEDDRKLEYEIAQVTEAINDLADKEKERQRREGVTINVYIDVEGDIRHDKELEDTVVRAVNAAIRDNKVVI